MLHKSLINLRQIELIFLDENTPKRDFSYMTLGFLFSTLLTYSSQKFTIALYSNSLNCRIEDRSKVMLHSILSGLEVQEFYGHFQYLFYTY